MCRGVAIFGFRSWYCIAKGHQSPRLMMILTVFPAFGMLHTMTSLLQTGSSLIAAYAGRRQPKSDFLSVVSDEGGETAQGVAISIQSAWRWLLEYPAGAQHLTLKGTP